jgi:hypothetical protein
MKNDLPRRHFALYLVFPQIWKRQKNETPSLEVMKLGHYSQTKVAAYGK